MFITSLNIILLIVLLSVSVLHVKKIKSLNGIDKRMDRLEACVIEEELTPAIVVEQEKKSLEEKKPEWAIITIDDFPNYKTIEYQLGYDDWASGALHFASEVYKKHGLLFESAGRVGELYVGHLQFDTHKIGNHVACNGKTVFRDKKFTKEFKECLK